MARALRYGWCMRCWKGSAISGEMFTGDGGTALVGMNIRLLPRKRPKRGEDAEFAIRDSMENDPIPDDGWVILMKVSFFRDNFKVPLK